MTLSVEVETARRERALVLPMSALRGGLADDQAEVRLERGGRVEARQVRLGLRTLDAAEVLQGLAEGDRVLLGAVPGSGRRVRADLAAAAPGAQRAREDAGSAMTNAMGR
ncbi:MAG TPA: efflux RND transporter periplasmic adaptor subunit, partial [Rubrivivax sp.]|nr:efflux RND transporter periplasmic adaptor subunit [Rubrivivax sp.]